MNEKEQPRQGNSSTMPGRSRALLKLRPSKVANATFCRVMLLRLDKLAKHRARYL
jgi:hypothetical protein